MARVLNVGELDLNYRFLQRDLVPIRKIMALFNGVGRSRVFNQYSFSHFGCIFGHNSAFIFDFDKEECVSYEKRVWKCLKAPCRSC